MMMMLKKPFHMLDMHVAFHLLSEKKSQLINRMFDTNLYEFVYVDLRAMVDRTFSRKHHTSMIYVYVDCCSRNAPSREKKAINSMELNEQLTTKSVSMIFVLLFTVEDNKLSIINADDLDEMTVIFVLYCSSYV